MLRFTGEDEGVEFPAESRRAVESYGEIGAEARFVERYVVGAMAGDGTDGWVGAGDVVQEVGGIGDPKAHVEAPDLDRDVGRSACVHELQKREESDSEVSTHRSQEFLK